MAFRTNVIRYCIGLAKCSRSLAQQQGDYNLPPVNGLPISDRHPGPPSKPFFLANKAELHVRRLGHLPKGIQGTLWPRARAPTTAQTHDVPHRVIEHGHTNLVLRVHDKLQGSHTGRQRIRVLRVPSLFSRHTAYRAMLHHRLLNRLTADKDKVDRLVLGGDREARLCAVLGQRDLHTGWWGSHMR